MKEKDCVIEAVQSWFPGQAIWIIADRIELLDDGYEGWKIKILVVDPVKQTIGENVNPDQIADTIESLFPYQMFWITGNRIRFVDMDKRKGWKIEIIIVDPAEDGKDKQEFFESLNEPTMKKLLRSSEIGSKQRKYQRNNPRETHPSLYVRRHSFRSDYERASSQRSYYNEPEFLTSSRHNPQFYERHLFPTASHDSQRRSEGHYSYYL